MKNDIARTLSWACYSNVVGADHEGNESTQITPFGAALLAKGASNPGKEAPIIASFLREWADGLEGKDG